MTTSEPMVGALLRMPWQAVRRRIHAELVRAGFDGVHPAHLQIFQYPGPEGLQPSELAARGQLSRQAVNHLLGQLENGGYLVRVASRTDARQRVIRLTDRGQELLQNILATLRTIEDEWRALMGLAEYQALRDGLQRLNALIVEHTTNGPS